MSLRGFTLVELLVVIAILAVLSCMLLPMVKMTTRTARASVCQSNLRQVGMAVGAYVSDSENVLMPGVRTAWAKMDPWGWLAWNWRGAIEQGQYFGNDRVGGGGNYLKVMGCPVQQAMHSVNPGRLYGDPDITTGWATYAANGHLTGIDPDFPPVLPDRGTPMGRIGRTASIYLASDGYWSINCWSPVIAPSVSRGAPGIPGTPHQGNSVILYVDGHVAQIGAIWILDNSPRWNMEGSIARDFWLGGL